MTLWTTSDSLAFAVRPANVRLLQDGRRPEREVPGAGRVRTAGHLRRTTPLCTQPRTPVSGVTNFATCTVHRRPADAPDGPITCLRGVAADVRRSPTTRAAPTRSPVSRRASRTSPTPPAATSAVDRTAPQVGIVRRCRAAAFVGDARCTATGHRDRRRVPGDGRSTRGPGATTRRTPAGVTATPHLHAGRHVPRSRWPPRTPSAIHGVQDRRRSAAKARRRPVAAVAAVAAAGRRRAARRPAAGPRRGGGGHGDAACRVRRSRSPSRSGGAGGGAGATQTTSAGASGRPRRRRRSSISHEAQERCPLALTARGRRARRSSPWCAAGASRAQVRASPSRSPGPSASSSSCPKKLKAGRLQPDASRSRRAGRRRRRAEDDQDHVPRRQEEEAGQAIGPARGRCRPELLVGAPAPSLPDGRLHAPSARPTASASPVRDAPVIFPLA